MEVFVVVVVVGRVLCSDDDDVCVLPEDAFECDECDGCVLWMMRWMMI